MIKDQLRKARKAAGKTQKEVAAHIGVTESTYCGYETGKSQPDALKIGRIAAFLNVTGDYLLETDAFLPPRQSDNSYLPLTADEKHLLDAYRQLNAEGQEKTVTYTDDLLATGRYIKNNPAVVAEEA